jgi:2-polyprenyl-3-methyl-5-hydroxy-6-metoxy-1,4-benzoquinol methylase
MIDDLDSYEAWQSSFKQSDNWDETYRRGQWDYLDGVGEIPRYAVSAGYIHKLLTHGHVLDAGGGEAILSQYLDLDRFRYTGFDISPTAVERARNRLRRGTVFVSSIDAFAAPPGVRYAAVVFSESLQHTEMPLESLDRYRDFLTPEGIIVVSLFKPDDQGKGSRLARLIAAECENGRYSLVDRSAAVSVSHNLTWEILVLR